jgi:anti-sigma regulatory factor (Ser/Thr protein kinase)
MNNHGASQGLILPVVWWARDFPGSAAQVGEVRRWLSGLLPDCEPRDDLLLLASELAANAVVHTRSGERGGQFSVHIEWSPDLARVVVGDQGALATPNVSAAPAAPAAPAGMGGPAWMSECGRGLLLVEELADDWGTASHPDGRCTWFDIQWGVRGGAFPVPGPAPAQRARAGGLEAVAR